MEERLGKISSVSFGFGGYQDAQIGLWLQFEGESWGVTGAVNGGWSTSIKWSEHCKWTEEGRTKSYAELVREISDLLLVAKVDSVDELLHKPVMVTFDGMMLTEWRILKEVL